MTSTTPLTGTVVTIYTYAAAHRLTDRQVSDGRVDILVALLATGFTHRVHANCDLQRNGWSGNRLSCNDQFLSPHDLGLTRMERIKRYVPMASRYVLPVLVVILLLGEASCTDSSSQSDRTSAVTSVAQVNLVEGWLVLDRPVRDVQVLDDLVLLSNSAPAWGRGPKDGAPFIVAFDPHSQEIAWEVKYVPIAPIVTNSQSLFVIEDSRLVAVDLDSGDEMWSVPFIGQRPSQVFCDDELVLAANRESVFAFNVTDGELHWESDSLVPLDPFVPLVTSFASWREHGALTKHDRTVYARRLDYHSTDECRFSLFALDADSGSEKWRFPVQQASLGECEVGTLPLVFGDGLTIVGTRENGFGKCVLTALDEDSGEIVWRYQGPESCFVRSFFLDRRFILISAGSILALEARTGDLLWRREYVLGSTQRPMANRGWVISSAGGTAEQMLSLVDLHSGEILDRLKVPLPENCRFAGSTAGLSKDGVVLIAGNCMRLFSISEGGRLKP
jgi:outer membrane protein assembly factor BamB